MSENYDVVNIAIIGGGLVGTLAAIYLARKGYHVDLYEYRDDTRKTENTVTGRNINLGLSARGQKALAGVGLEEAVLDKAVPMNGKIYHGRNGINEVFDYRKQDILYSLKRKHINEVLLNAAEKEKNIQIMFNHKLVGADFENCKMEFVNPLTDEKYEKLSDFIIGCDGAYSAVRKLLMRGYRLEYTQSYAEHGYFELPIPKTENGKSPIAINYLHIWQMPGRNRCGMFALQNQDHTWNFTVLLHWKELEAMKTSEDVLRVFTTNFPDVVEMMGEERLCKHILSLDPRSIIMTKSEPANICPKVLLMGDASHSMHPWSIQGMNTGLEDVSVLMESLTKCGGDCNAAFEDFNKVRLRDTIAMADMEKRKYLFLVNAEVDKNNSWRKTLDNVLYKMFPNFWIPLFEAITFTNIPYTKCAEQSDWQNKVVGKIVTTSWIVAATGALSVAGLVYLRGRF